MELKQQAFSVFNALKIGQSIVIHKFASRDPKAFIQYAKQYVDLYQSLEFNNEYTIITKIETSEQIFKRLNKRF